MVISKKNNSASRRRQRRAHLVQKEVVPEESPPSSPEIPAKKTLQPTHQEQMEAYFGPPRKPDRKDRFAQLLFNLGVSDTL